MPTQLTLFRHSMDVALANAGVSRDEMRRWHRRGWLSFDYQPIDVQTYDDPQINELLFVRDVVRSALSDVQIRQVLRQCPRPLYYHPDFLVYHFRYGLVECLPQPSTDDLIGNDLDTWLENQDRDTLTALREQIDEMLQAQEDSDE